MLGQLGEARADLTLCGVSDPTDAGTLPKRELVTVDCIEVYLYARRRAGSE
jgi:hypothetical protein